jgi:hypothetical protein
MRCQGTLLYGVPQLFFQPLEKNMFFPIVENKRQSGKQTVSPEKFIRHRVVVVGAATEYFMAKKRGDPVTEAVFVTALLLGLSMPPTIPFWQAGVGMFVAILFGKEVFGR